SASCSARWSARKSASEIRSSTVGLVQCDMGVPLHQGVRGEAGRSPIGDRPAGGPIGRGAASRAAAAAGVRRARAAAGGRAGAGGWSLAPPDPAHGLAVALQVGLRLAAGLLRLLGGFGGVLGAHALTASWQVQRTVAVWPLRRMTTVSNPSQSP